MNENPTADPAPPRTAYPVSAKLPREFAPGLHWLGGCSDSGAWPTRKGATTHEHLSTYLVAGTDKTVLIDTGHYAQWDGIRDQLDACLGDRPLDYVFPTHHEIPHAGNLGRLLARYPDAVAVGDTREYHLYFPEIAPERLRRTRGGDSIDLGGTSLMFLDPVWYDLSGTLWAYETRGRTLFTSDGLGYIHDHSPDVCGLLPGEVPQDAPEHGIRRYALPFVGMRYHRMAPGVARYRELTERHPVRTVCSAHGAPLSGGDLAEVTEDALRVIEENQHSISGPSGLEPAGQGAAR
ncbi:MBL fold metallo-hydrolase [Actinomadura sp. 7K507]|uniref:MBL fold metallo-hydrolase n=1 Tax=Actinomadura sp. 7K507 TaxID=2530365 RepID=UPI00140463E3|nr:MBL fold metallo-hydrolase [Actinomadura sp. 7K507]